MGGRRHALSVAVWGLSAMLLTCPDAGGAPLRTLVRAGDLATDGSRLAAIGGLSTVRGHVVFDAREDALIRVASDGAPVVLVRAGDTLPVPTPGRIDVLAAPAVTPDGTVVFWAGLDSPAPASALLAIDAAGPKVLTLGTGTPTSIAANSALDVVMQQGTARLRLWRPTTAGFTTIAERNQELFTGDRLDRIGARPGLSDDGTVAFLASVRSSRPSRFRSSLVALRWRQDAGLEELAAGRAVRRISAGALASVRVAINRRGDVAEIVDSATGVFVHPVDGSPAYRVAKPGDLVDGVALDGPEPGVLAIDDRLRIAFLGRFGATRRIVLAEGGGLRALTGDLGAAPIAGATRLPPGNAVAWISNGTLALQRGQAVASVGPHASQPLGPGFDATGAPCLDDAGDTIVEMERRSIYMATRGGALPLVRAGDPVVGAVPIAVVQGQQGNTGGDLSVHVTLEDGHRALLVRKGNMLRRLVTDGDPSPLGGVMQLDDLPPHDVGGRHAAMVLTTVLPDGSSVQGLFDRPSRGGLRAVVSDAGGARQFFDLDTPLALREGIAFHSQVFDPKTGSQTIGLFFAHRGAVRTIATPGDRAPGSAGRHIADIGAVVGTGRDAIFLARLDGPGDQAAFLAWRPGRGLRRLDRPAPGSSAVTISQFVAAPSFVVGFEPDDGSSPGRLLALDRRGRVVLARTGDPSPLGGSLVIGDGLVPTRHGVAFVAARAADDARAAAILEVSLPRRGH